MFSFSSFHEAVTYTHSSKHPISSACDMNFQGLPRLSNKHRSHLPTRQNAGGQTHRKTINFAKSVRSRVYRPTHMERRNSSKRRRGKHFCGQIIWFWFVLFLEWRRFAAKEKCVFLCWRIILNVVCRIYE